MSNDRIMFDNGTGANSVVAHDNPLPVGGEALGAPDDAPTTDPNTDNSLIALNKAIVESIQSDVPTPVQMVATTNNGLINTRRLSTGSDNTGSTTLAAEGVIYGVTGSNRAGADCYVKIYDKATAATFADTPVSVITIPAGGAVPANPVPIIGLPLLNGFSFRIVTGSADNDDTSVAAGDVDVTFTHTA